MHARKTVFLISTRSPESTGTRGQCTLGSWYVSNIRLYIEADSDYVFQPATFWDRWSEIFPGGREFCSSLRAWRRKDQHSGSRPFEIIMGTEEPKARTGGGMELPPVGWSDGLITESDSGTTVAAQPITQ